MKKPLKNLSFCLLNILLLLGVCSMPIAWAESEPEVGSNFQAAATADKEIDEQRKSLQRELSTLDRDIAVVQALSKKVDNLPLQDSEAVLFRLDARTFKVFQSLDQVIRLAALLPAEDIQRVEIERRLREDLADVRNSAFARIESLDSRITTLKTGLESLSGGQLLATTAYISSLESLRIQYYQEQVNVIAGLSLLSIPADTMEQRVRGILYLRAETLVGKTEFTGSALKEMRRRLESEPENSDLGTTIKNFSHTHKKYLERLEIMAGLLQRLSLDSSVYDGVLLQQGKTFSVRDLKGPAFKQFLLDSERTLQESLVKNAPDIVFRALVFVVVIVIFRILSRFARRATIAACERSNADLSVLLRDTLASVSSGAVMIIGLLMALSQIGISLGPMLAGLGVAGFVLGFALQDSLSNFAAGAMILIYRPYDVDDFVEVTGASGLVKKMSLVSTTITTFDNQTLVVPNSKIWGDVIKNVTAQQERRVDLTFGIGYSDDIAHAERVITEIVENHKLVLKSPEARIKLHSLGDSSVNFIVRPWVKTEHYWDVYWDLTREVKIRFDAEGISIPFPQQDVHLYTDKESTT